MVPINKIESKVVVRKGQEEASEYGDAVGDASNDNTDVSSTSESVFDSGEDESNDDVAEYDSNLASETDDDAEESDDQDFENQGSSDEESLLEEQQIEADNESEEELEIFQNDDDIGSTFESIPRYWNTVSNEPSSFSGSDQKNGNYGEVNNTKPTDDPAVAQWIQTDNLSSTTVL